MFEENNKELPVSEQEITADELWLTFTLTGAPEDYCDFCKVRRLEAQRQAIKTQNKSKDDGMEM